MLATLFATLVAMTVTLHIKVIDVESPSRTGMKSCTGVFVASDKILSAAHCFEGAQAAWARTNDNKSFTLSPIYADIKKDLALVRVQGVPAHTHIAKLENNYKKLDAVYIASSADDMPATYTFGYIANTVNEKVRVMIVHSAQILPGSSGSGLFNSRGQLIGINTLIYKSLTYAVSSEDIKVFLYEASLRDTQ